MYELTNVQVQVGQRQLLRDISFTLAQGQLTAVLGANGAGKSSLLKTLVGEYLPTAGDILFKGKPLCHWQPGEIATERAIMLQQQRPVFDFSVLDYLLLARNAWTENRAMRLARTEQLVAALSLETFLDKPITQLSGGEWQRIQFARAWLQVLGEKGVAGKLLLLDEPTAALDIYQQQRFFAALREFVSLGGTAVVVLHDLNQAARVADQFLLLQQGALLAAGTAQVAFTASHLSQCFAVEGHLRQDPHSGKAYFHYH